MDKKYRERSENWTVEEKEIFIEIMKDSVRVIECKNTDTNTNKKKQAEWQKVQKKFQELTGKLRVVSQLKGFWRRTRLGAKKKVFQHRRALHATGGGEKPSSPSQEEQKIIDMCPTDFVTEENEFDSDSIFYKKEITHDTSTEKVIDDLVCSAGSSDFKGTSTPPRQEDITFILDNEDEIQEGEQSNFEEIIIAVNNPEVAIKTARFMLMSDGGTKSDEKEVREKNNYKENTSTPHRPQKTIADSQKRRKVETSHKAAIIKSNIDIKEKSFSLLDEEHALKMQYQKLELCHQELRHKFEIDILMIDKEKKELELKLLKKQFL